MKKISLILCLILSIPFSVLADADTVSYPRIGERCPDFLLTDVQQFHKKEVSLDDFKGKWLILDFWGEYCTACIGSFPKMNWIQQTFATDIQILFIGVPYKDPNTIKKLYEVHREKLGLKIPIVYDDKLAEQFGVQSYPHLVVVDPEGIVRYITISVSEENVRDMIEDKQLTLRHKYNKFEATSYDEYSSDMPFLISGNGGHELDYLSRAVLAKATKRTPPLRFTIHPDRLEILGFPLANLYQYAYIGNTFNTLHNLLDRSYGVYWPVAVIEVKDSTLFSPNRVTMENLFSYSIHVPGRSVGKSQLTLDFREMLKNDLDALFPFTTQFEPRIMPCYYLRIDRDKVEQLRSRHQEREMRYAKEGEQGFVGKKVALSQIITKLIHSPGYDTARTTPMVFEGENIEIDIEYESVYFEDIVEELRSKGIEISKEQKEMIVLVIRDK